MFWSAIFSVLASLPGTPAAVTHPDAPDIQERSAIIARSAVVNKLEELDRPEEARAVQLEPSSLARGAGALNRSLRQNLSHAVPVRTAGQFLLSPKSQSQVLAARTGVTLIRRSGAASIYNSVFREAHRQPAMKLVVKVQFAAAVAGFPTPNAMDTVVVNPIARPKNSALATGSNSSAGQGAAGISLDLVESTEQWPHRTWCCSQAQTVGWRYVSTAGKAAEWNSTNHRSCAYNITVISARPLTLKDGEHSRWRTLIPTRSEHHRRSRTPVKQPPLAVNHAVPADHQSPALFQIVRVDTPRAISYLHIQSHKHFSPTTNFITSV